MTKDYYGTKRITAWEQIGPIKNVDDLPRMGYAVKYEDGYTSWSPKDVFEAAYQPIDAMSFGHAVVALKAGQRVAREGWNGKGMWLKLIPVEMAEAVAFQHEALYAQPWIGMKTAQEMFVPWVASQSDMLADDWRIVE